MVVMCSWRRQEMHDYDDDDDDDGDDDDDVNN